MDLFTSKREHLKNDYRDASGEYSDSCTLIAIELARLLKAEGGNPRILIIRGERREDGNRMSLVPVSYDGRVIWGAHVVCELDGIVYDPMLESSLPIEVYVQTAFAQPVEIEDYSQILDRE
ncbi:hypothetical protein EOL96_05700 [Candidatus Saccharibacteria bacterium]|nr:hypothetical protein [Candidatus Saccharibacteria bacterium]